MQQYYYVGLDNQSHGPVTPDQFLSCGLTPSTLICPVGGSKWEALYNYPDLMRYLTPGGSGVHTYDDQTLSADETPHKKPQSYLVWSILATLFCCLPFGIVAIVYASKVSNYWDAKNYGAAYKASSKAKLWCILSLIAGAVFMVLYSYNI